MVFSSEANFFSTKNCRPKARSIFPGSLSDPTHKSATLSHLAQAEPIRMNNEMGNRVE